MEAGGPRSRVGGLSGKGTLPHWLEAGKTLLPGRVWKDPAEGELITEKASAPEHRARLRAWEQEGEPWGGGSAQCRGSAGAVHPSAGGMGTQGATPWEGFPSAPNPRPTRTPPLPLCILVPAIRVGGPRPQSPTPPARVLPRCPSFPTSGSGPSSAQRHGLCWEGHCADAQGHS